MCFLLITLNSPASVLERPLTITSIAFANSLHDKNGPYNDAHKTHNQAQGTHHIFFCLW